MREVSKELAARGYLNERDKPYAAKSVASMLRKHALEGPGEPPNSRWYVVAHAQGGSNLCGLSKGPAQQFSFHKSVFFSRFDLLSAVGESELSSKADMTDAIGSSALAISGNRWMLR